MRVLNEEDVNGWIPSGEQKSVVTMLTAFGHTPEEIALVIYPSGPISVSTLRRKFNNELKKAKPHFEKWLFEQMEKNISLTGNGLVLTTLWKEYFGEKDKESKRDEAILNEGVIEKPIVWKELVNSKMRSTIENEKKEDYLSRIKFCVDCKFFKPNNWCGNENYGLDLIFGRANLIDCIDCRDDDHKCGLKARGYKLKDDDYYDKVRSEINSMADTLPKKPKEINEMEFTEEKLIDLAASATKEQNKWEEVVKETCELYQELARAANNLRYALYGGDEEL